jgi:hypothetical protein
MHQHELVDDSTIRLGHVLPHHGRPKEQSNRNGQVSYTGTILPQWLERYAHERIETDSFLTVFCLVQYFEIVWYCTSKARVLETSLEPWVAICLSCCILCSTENYISTLNLLHSFDLGKLQCENSDKGGGLYGRRTASPPTGQQQSLAANDENTDANSHNHRHTSKAYIPVWGGSLVTTGLMMLGASGFMQVVVYVVPPVSVQTDGSMVANTVELHEPKPLSYPHHAQKAAVHVPQSVWSNSLHGSQSKQSETELQLSSMPASHSKSYVKGQVVSERISTAVHVYGD